MPNVLLIVQRMAIVQGLMNKLPNNSNIQLIHEAKFSNVVAAASLHDAKVILIEVAESGPYDVDYCLKLCQEIRSLMPKCKLILMCSEQNEESVKQVIDAKWQGKIDDFVFYDVTMDYLASKLKSL